MVIVKSGLRKKRIVFFDSDFIFILLFVGVSFVQDVSAEEFEADLHVSSGYGRKPDVAMDNSEYIYVCVCSLEWSKLC
ncbi:MAG: hypothetical protein V5A68_03555 [Candidatus Thermoplasmatota archaeon]